MFCVRAGIYNIKWIFIGFENGVCDLNIQRLQRSKKRIIQIKSEPLPEVLHPQNFNIFLVAYDKWRHELYTKWIPRVQRVVLT